MDIEHYVADLSRPGALTAALNYYRANLPVEVLAGLAARPALRPVASRCWASGPTVTSGAARPRCSPRNGT